MISLTGITRTYEVGGRPVNALRGVDLHVPDGDYIAVMGPSGSGKSTLLNILGCLDRPTAGSYVLDGREVANLSDQDLSLVRRHKIGFVFQVFHLVPRLTAVENVALPLLFAGAPARERHEKALRALTAVGLAERAHHRPDQLSGGERQRVAVARATIMGPSILLADEPTGNLDTKSGLEVIELLESMNRGGLTLVVVTHDPGIGGRARRRLRLVDGSAELEPVAGASGKGGGPAGAEGGGAA
jgi:putative ABC transport system ATP-binding protein